MTLPNDYRCHQMALSPLPPLLDAYIPTAPTTIPTNAIK